MPEIVDQSFNDFIQAAVAAQRVAVRLEGIYKESLAKREQAKKELKANTNKESKKHYEELYIHCDLAKQNYDQASKAAQCLYRIAQDVKDGNVC